MGATNHTTYYELSQFIGTDKPAWLQDYNGDMTKIDAGIKEAKNAADDADTAASNAQGDATDALNAIETINTTLGTIEDTLGTATGNISTINSLIGNGTPTTSDQTIIGAISGIEGAIAPREDGENLANSYAIGEQFARGGTVYKALTSLTAGTAFSSLVLDTNYEISNSLVDQIVDLEGDLENKLDKEVHVLASVTADGVKTYSELLDELYDSLSPLSTNFIHTILVRDNANIYTPCFITSQAFVYSETLVNVADTLHAQIGILSSGSVYRLLKVDTSDETRTYTDYSSLVAPSGVNFKIYR